MLNKKRTWLMLGALLLLAVILLILLFIFYPRKYYRDRLVVLGQQDGTNFALVLELTRHEIVPFVYMHGYTLDYLTPDKSYSQLATTQSLSPAVQPQKFLTAFTNHNNYNTSEENYAAAISFADQVFNINLQNLKGDFIVNNVPERLTYVDMGTATIQLNNQSIPVAYMLSKGSSTDAAAVRLSDDAEYFGQHSFFASASGELYLVDASEVADNTTNYESHIWLLHKNAAGYLKKYTTKNEITLTTSETCNQSMQIAPNHYIETTETKQVSHQLETICLVSGSEEIADQLSPLVGLALIKR